MTRIHLTLCCAAIAASSCTPPDTDVTRVRHAPLPEVDSREPIRPSEAVLGDSFAAAVAIRGTEGVVGAPDDPTDADGAGSIVAFRRLQGEWTEIARYGATTPRAERHFGTRVAIGASFLAAGSACDPSVAGTVDARTGPDFASSTELTSADGDPGDCFGAALAARGSALAIGAPNADAGGVERGRVYLFGHDTMTDEWLQQATVAPAGASDGDRFGHAIAWEGSTLAVSNAPDDGSAPTVTVFERGTSDWEWVEATTLQAPDEAEEFGEQMALTGTALVVTAPGSSGAYLYRRVGEVEWELVRPLAPSSLEANQRFGVSVDADGDLIAIGAPRDDVDDVSGNVFVYGRDFGERDSWNLAGPLEEPVQRSPAFGSSVAVAGGMVFGGAPDVDFNDGAVWSIGFEFGPRAVDDEYFIGGADTWTANLEEGVLNNDLFPAEWDGGELVRLVTPPQGNVELAPDGSFSYQAPPQPIVTDEFEYTIDDGRYESEPARVVLTRLDGTLRFVPPTPSGPIPAAEGRRAEITFRAEDGDPETTATYSSDELPDGATLDDTTGRFRWTPGYRDARFDVTAEDEQDTVTRRFYFDVTFTDTDRDNVPDTWERENGLDPDARDSDGDGLRDDIEIGDIDDPRDTDGDGTLDALDEDSDGDGIADVNEAPDGTALDTDRDGIPDFRDEDSDADGVPDADDNCRAAANPGQADADGDGIGDACQPVDPDGDTGDGTTDDGCSCSTVHTPEDRPSRLWLGVLILAWIVARRRRPTV